MNWLFNSYGYTYISRKTTKQEILNQIHRFNQTIKTDTNTLILKYWYESFKNQRGKTFIVHIQFKTGIGHHLHINRTQKMCTRFLTT